MKQKLLYIIMFIAILAWSGEAWGIDWVNNWSSAPSLDQSFYIYNVNNNVFVISGGSGASSITSNASSATYWTYKNVQTSYWAFGTHYVDHYNLSSPNNQFIRFDRKTGDYDAYTNETSSDNNTEIQYDYSNGKFQIRNRVSGVQQYYLFVTNNKLRVKYVAGSSGDYYQWYFINQIQYNNHLAIEAYEPVNNNVTSNYSTDNLPDAFYNQVKNYLNPTTGYLNYSSWLSSTDKSSSINTATSQINTWLSTAPAMKTAYANALATIATAKTNSTNNNPTDIAASDISEAETALEAATTTTAIAKALAKIKNFDAITFDPNISTSILAGNTVSDVASAVSTRTLSYSSSNSSVISVNGSTLTAVSAGTATITATTSSTGDGYYKCTKTQQFTVVRNANTLTVIGNQDLKVDGTITGVYSNNNSNATLQYSITNEVYTNPSQNNGTGVISFDLTTNKITALNAGTATLRIYQKTNGVYEGVDKSFDVTVTKYDQTLSWTSEDFTILPTEVLDVAETTSSLQVTYTTTDGSVISVTEEPGKVKGKTEGTATITASQVGNYKYNAATSIEHLFTVSKKQATFTPTWGESASTDIKVGMTTSIGLTNIATDATFTVSANPTGIISWTREGNTLTINGDVAGTTELTLSQTGNAFLNGNTATYTITVSRYPNTFAVAAETQAMKVGDIMSNVVTDNGNANTVVTYSTEGIATYDATTNSITAVGEGSTTITFTQAATATHAAATKTIGVTVTKVANTLAVSLPTQAVNVGGTIALSITGQNNADAIVGTITDTQLSSSVNNGSEVITYTNGVITACNAGKAKITFSQPATTQYTAYTSDTYEITVSKIHNTITITNLNGGTATNTTMKYGKTASLAYTSTNTDTSPVVSRISGSYTTYSAGTITSGNSAGTDIYEITQAETYKYEAGYASFTVRVNNTDEGVGYVLYEEKEYSHGTGSGIAHTYSWSGPGETLYYKACRGTAITIYYNLYVEWSADNQNWTECQNNTSLDPEYRDDFFSCPIPENARYVRFRFPAGGTLVKYIKDVRITRKTYLEASSDKTALGETYTDETQTATFTVDYSSVNGENINISSNNQNFVPSISTISIPKNKTATDNSAGKNTTYITGIDGKQTFTVTYTPNPDQLAEESAVISIGDLFYSRQITLTATPKKYPTSITRGTNTATATTVDGTIDNVFAFSGTSTATPSASSESDFYYSISSSLDEGVHNGINVISYNPVTNTITGLEAGTARLTIYQKKTLKYHATSQSFDFTVTRLPNNVDIALSATELDVDGLTTVTMTNPVSDGALSATYSNVTYTNESQNREGGLLTFAGNTLTGWNAGTGTVTITQAETYKYVAKIQSFDVTVNKLSQTLTWVNPSLETTMQVGSTLEGNTATSDVGLTPVTYSSGNTAAITVDANTGVLTAVATGSNVGITASQAGNYKYLPATLTRQFSVFNKQTPAFAADTHFEGTNGRVEYTGTATIMVTGVGADSEQGFTITNGDNSIINVVRDGETITITGLQVGSTTLTLAQEGNDDFIAKSQTYNIEVYWPDDFLALSSTVVPTHTAGTYRKVFVNNTLKSGYSTIALPFDVDVEELTGRETNADDWVAQLSVVTYNAKDGYSLYFEKKNTIEANQPYILHLGTAVDSPVFTDVSVVAAEEATQNATNGVHVTDWTMHSNYDPAFDMEGKYGVVNDGAVLKKGAANSTLKALHAYIEGPTSAQVKAAYLDEDEADGILELINNQENQSGDQLIYDLQGRRLPRAQAGINIVIRDGKVRKEIESRR